ncbi:MAG: hypothetical protein K2N46_10310 [Lachnospiraceae bacterium]|nr:hypothetical protein [Lachnospiraceae bacterium]
MGGQDGYGFCPRCGAVMQEGVCRSCGYSTRRDADWQGSSAWQTGSGWQEPFHGQAQTGGQEPSLRPVKKQKKPGRGRVVAFTCAGIGILFLIAIIVFMVISIRRVFDEVQKNTMPGYGYDSGNGYFGYGNPYDDSLPDGYGDYDDSNGYYKPDEKDDYYEEITDATSQDLDYKVIWESVSMRPDDSDDSCTYDGVYPVLRDEEGQEEEKFSSMNQKIRDMVCKYKDKYRDYASGISSSGYVTYMDEEKISVVVRHSFYEKKTTIPRVEAITLRVDTGEVISHEEMAQVDEELAWQFRSRNSHQNGTVEFVDELSDEKLMEYLKDEEDSVMFYTPVGLEVGFNYDGGWVTVTLKTDTL